MVENLVAIGVRVLEQLQYFCGWVGGGRGGGVHSPFAYINSTSHMVRGGKVLNTLQEFSSPVLLYIWVKFVCRFVVVVVVVFACLLLYCCCLTLRDSAC